MQGKDFLYFLVDELGRSYYVENGIVKLSAQPRPLEYTPEGWEELEVQYGKNQKYFVLDREVTLPLDFVEDGATIVKDAYYKKGPLAKMYLILCQQALFYDGNEYGYYYKGVYRGALDFTEFKHKGAKVAISISEGGAVKYIKANENAVYEIDVDVPEAVKIKMDGIRLIQKANYLVTNGALPNDLAGHIIEVPLLGNEAISSINATSEDRVVTGNAPSNLWNTGQRILTTGNETTEVTVNWDFDLFVSLAGGVGAIFGTRILLQCHVLLDENTRYEIPGLEAGANLQAIGGGDPLLLYNRTHHFNGSFTFTAPANARVILYMSANQNRDLTFFTYGSNGTFSIDYTYTHRTTYIKALPPLYLFQKLIEKVTGGRYQADSTLLDSNFNIPITCGDAIRGIEGAKIKTSLSQFFQAMNTVHGVGMGEVGGIVKMETKSNWVDYSDPVDLGEVADLQVNPATNYLFNLLNVGYQPQEYDDVNGRQEWNNTSKYTGPEIEETKTLELISPYRADCYGIEFLRLNLEGKTTTDSDSDNDVFMIHTKAVPINDPVEGLVYELNRDLNAGATGLIQPETVFNLYLSPARCLRRNGDFIRACTYKMDGEKLVWQTTDKNPDVAAGGIVERADVTIGSLATPLFTANLLEFETPSPVDLVELMASNPGRAFKFTYQGVELKGIAVKIGIRLGDYAAQTFQLLSAPDNDLTQLINVME